MAVTWMVFRLLRRRSSAARRSGRRPSRSAGRPSATTGLPARCSCCGSSARASGCPSSSTVSALRAATRCCSSALCAARCASRLCTAWRTSRRETAPASKRAWTSSRVRSRRCRLAWPAVIDWLRKASVQYCVATSLITSSAVFCRSSWLAWASHWAMSRWVRRRPQRSISHCRDTPAELLRFQSARWSIGRLPLLLTLPEGCGHSALSARPA
ncbi:hypothetical protein D3C71_1290080 [compost metagenome]